MRGVRVSGDSALLFICIALCTSLAALAYPGTAPGYEDEDEEEGRKRTGIVQAAAVRAAGRAVLNGTG